MTTNQIAAMRLQEDSRHNLETEKLGKKELALKKKAAIAKGIADVGKGIGQGVLNPATAIISTIAKGGR